MVYLVGGEGHVVEELGPPCGGGLLGGQQVQRHLHPQQRVVVVPVVVRLPPQLKAVTSYNTSTASTHSIGGLYIVIICWTEAAILDHSVKGE